MSDKHTRTLERSSLINGPTAQEKHARAICREKGHRWHETTSPDPHSPGRVIVTRWCWRCLFCEASLLKNVPTQSISVGPYGLVTAKSTTGRTHVVNLIPPYKSPPEGRRVAESLALMMVLEDDRQGIRVPAICPAWVRIPPTSLTLPQAQELAAAQISCKHCWEAAESYSPVDPDSVNWPIRRANVAQTKTHYLLRYGAQQGHIDVTKCAVCNHPIHLHFDCLETSCECDWAVAGQ